MSDVSKEFTKVRARGMRKGEPQLLKRDGWLKEGRTFLSEGRPFYNLRSYKT